MPERPIDPPSDSPVVGDLCRQVIHDDPVRVAAAVWLWFEPERYAGESVPDVAGWFRTIADYLDGQD